MIICVGVQCGVDVGGGCCFDDEMVVIVVEYGRT